ncbi:hypothetical protein PBY51_013421 [Eleginops maclovinus]|uniref:Uncharacterized protein n=1 Tax=Eleginops maclovinus TaxID=56733 RepID=A0AAN7XZ75_ELEMC|nr:hypothetical protein PBY51_013421 [Eleginops maclovinus]
MHLTDHKEAHTQCYPIICSRQTSEAYLKATFTQQSLWLAIIGLKVHRCDVQYFGYVVFSACVHRAELRRRWASQVSGSSRQDLLAVSCLIGTPSVCFSSAVALISASLLFVISQS